jgi:lipopolysaccharide biosynthesis glycosyltransferase
VANSEIVTLAVALCTDRMMEAPLHAAACSMLAHASVELDFYFMLNGFDAKRRDLLRNSLDLSGKPYRATFVDEPGANELATLRAFHGNRTPYYRLFLPEVVPADRLLYVDSDTVSVIDVAPLLALPMSHASGFVPAGVTGTYIERELFAKIGLPPDTPAFNSGVMLFDLKAWREQKLGKATLDFCHKYQEYDQTGLIAMAAGRFDQLEDRYNAPLYTSSPLAIAREYPGIYHFVGSPKPWDIGGRQFHSCFAIYAGALEKTVWRRHATDYMSMANWRRAYKVKGGYARKLLAEARRRFS